MGTVPVVRGGFEGGVSVSQRAKLGIYCQNCLCRGGDLVFTVQPPFRANLGIGSSQNPFWLELNPLLARAKWRVTSSGPSRAGQYVKVRSPASRARAHFFIHSNHPDSPYKIEDRHFCQSSSPIPEPHKGSDPL